MIMIYSVKETVDNINFILQFYTTKGFGISYLSFSSIHRVFHQLDKLDIINLLQAERQFKHQYGS